MDISQVPITPHKILLLYVYKNRSSSCSQPENRNAGTLDLTFPLQSLLPWKQMEFGMPTAQPTILGHTSHKPTESSPLFNSKRQRRKNISICHRCNFHWLVCNLELLRLYYCWTLGCSLCVLTLPHIASNKCSEQDLALFPLLSLQLILGLFFWISEQDMQDLMFLLLS